MASWDVIVIGLGGVGSAATYHLAAAGHRVLGIDQYPLAHDRGSSHGKTRIIRQAYFEHPAYVPLLRRAYELWDDIERRANQKLFYRTGLVEMGPADGVVIAGVLRSAAEHNLSVEQLPVSEIMRRWPGIVGHHDWHAVIEHNAGFLKVEDCVRAHHQLALQAGASCLHGVTVKAWEADGSGIQVVTDQGVERADRLVVAGGPWNAVMLAAVHPYLQVLRKHQYWFEADQPGYEEQEGFPCFFHETPAGLFYGFPSIDGSGVKVARHSGGERLHEPQASDHPPDQLDRALVDTYVATYLPGVSRRQIAEAGCYYTMTPDEHFILDVHPEQPQVTIVAGLSGHGFKFTSVLGEIASQLAISGSTTQSISLFALDRLGQ